jgi:mRNA degradation ribonuclease J1/J2
MPVHGEYRHLVEHKSLAKDLGMKSENIFIMENGRVLELSRNEAKTLDKVACGSILIDGLGIGDVGNIVLRDRKELGTHGVITVVMTLDANEFRILTGPDVLTRGFVYVRESEELIKELRDISRFEVEKCLENKIKDWNYIKTNLKAALSRYVYTKTKRSPIILPIIMEVEI